MKRQKLSTRIYEDKSNDDSSRDDIHAEGKIIMYMWRR